MEYKTNKLTAMADVCCPSCGKSMDAATGVTTADAPAPGDLSVCFYCYVPMMFTGEGKEASGLRLLTDEDRADPQVAIFIDTLSTVVHQLAGKTP